MRDVDAAAGTVSAIVEVALPPAEAFRVFTAEIGSWYVVDEHTVADHRRTVDIRVEPFVGGHSWTCTTRSRARDARWGGSVCGIRRTA